MIGSPVGGVRTPPLLQDFLAGQGSAEAVTAVDVMPDALAAFMARARADVSVAGLLVTMPHKKTIIPLLDGLSATATAAASVNAVKRVPSGGLVGAQFDGVALVKALTTRGAPVADSRVLLAGLGGAGTAIAHALVAHGCRRLEVHDLDAARVRAALAGLNADVLAVTEPGRDGYEILINATPLGMASTDPSPFSAALVENAGWVADIVADPAPTRLAELTRGAGTRLITGRQMVEQQIELIGRWLLSPDVEQAAAFRTPGAA